MAPAKSKSIVAKIMEYWQLILLLFGIIGSWYNVQTKVSVQQVQIENLEEKVEKLENSKGKLWEVISKKQDKP